MASVRSATYKIYNGTDWDTYYFATSAGQVGETTALKFLRPATHTVNGKSFLDGSSHRGITLYGSDIAISNSDSATISSVISNLKEEVGRIDDRIEGMDDVATPNTNGLMSSADKTRLDSMWAVWSADDDDKLVNKVEEVLAVFENYTEGSNLATLLASKQNIITSNNKLSFNLISDVPMASKISFGLVNVGDNITITNGIISLTSDNIVSALGYDPGENNNYVKYFYGSAEPSEMKTGDVWLQY